MGHFCSTGSVAPTPCAAGTVAPANGATTIGDEALANMLWTNEVLMDEESGANRQLGRG